MLSQMAISYWASLMAQLIKNPPAMQETWVQSLVWEDPLEKRTATHSSILENSTDCIAHGITRSQTQLSNFHFHFIPYYGWVIFHSVYLLKPTISFDYVKSQTALLAFSGEDGGRRKMLYDPQCEEYSCPIKNCSMSCTTFESPTEQLAQVKYLFVSFQF